MWFRSISLRPLWSIFLSSDVVPIILRLCYSFYFSQFFPGLWSAETFQLGSDGKFSCSFQAWTFVLRLSSGIYREPSRGKISIILFQIVYGRILASTFHLDWGQGIHIDIYLFTYSFMYSPILPMNISFSRIGLTDDVGYFHDYFNVWRLLFSW